MGDNIKTLADEIRDKLRAERGDPPANAPPVISVSPDAEFAPVVQEVAEVAAAAYEFQAQKFFKGLDDFSFSGTHKSMIRVDERTMRLLKHLKLVRGVEMNKVIVYALHQLLAKNPWLVTYIQDSLKNPNL